MLWIALFLHQGNRQIYNSVLPLIKNDLGLSAVQLGLVGTIFTLVYGVLVPIAGFAGDFFPRKRLLLFSLVVFSMGTLLTGLSTGLGTFILFLSIATGAGEAFFFPSATSLIAQFHERTRAQALGILQTGLYIGIISSGWISGAIGERFGWRKPFLLFGAAGLLWAVVLGLRLQNTPQAAPVAAAGQAARIPRLEVLAAIVRRPSVWLLAMAFGAMVYVDIGFKTWTPTFLHEQFNLSLGQAGFSAMFYHYLFAFFGVLVGSRVADRLAESRLSVRMEANFLGLFLGAPFLFWLGRASSAHANYIALAFFGLFRGIYDSNLYAALYDVIEPRLRASATGLMISFAFVVGSLAPTVLGWMKERMGLAAGLSSLGWCYLFGATCVLIAARFFLRRDAVSADTTSRKPSNHS